MSRAECYQDLARVFSYPWRKEPLQASVERLSASATEKFAEFRKYIAASPLSSLQEEYVAAFDMNPACAPYLGHHLYGEHRMRGEYLMRLRALYREMDFSAPEPEPADHVATMLGFAAYLGQDGPAEELKSFVGEYLIDGVRRFAQATESRGSFPWKGAVAEALAVCAADCEEDGTCSTQ